MFLLQSLVAGCSYKWEIHLRIERIAWGKFRATQRLSYFLSPLFERGRGVGTLTHLVSALVLLCFQSYFPNPGDREILGDCSDLLENLSQNDGPNEIPSRFYRSSGSFRGESSWWEGFPTRAHPGLPALHGWDAFSASSDTQTHLSAPLRPKRSKGGCTFVWKTQFLKTKNLKNSDTDENTFHCVEPCLEISQAHISGPATAGNRNCSSKEDPSGLGFSL